MGRILVFSEAVTLAHLARPLALIDRLPAGWEIHLACPDNAYRRFLKGFRHVVHDLGSMAPERFRRALDWGLPVFTNRLLRRYVEEDLGFIERVRPDVVVGDFRLSLSISARVAGVPYYAIANAYWRPEFQSRPPMPCLKPLTPFPRQWVEPVFHRLIDSVFSAHAAPFNRLRKDYGLSCLPSDVRYFYTDGDTVLYADLPSLYPDLRLPGSHHFLGPLPWSPPVMDPPWWKDLPGDGPIIYVVAGSSGSGRLFGRVIELLAAEPATVIAATGGSECGARGNLFYAPWLDGRKAAMRATLMICNGGAMGCQQALTAGIPVIGVTTNMDQMLNMRAVQSAGFGLEVRGDEVEKRLLPSVSRLRNVRLAGVEEDDRLFSWRGFPLAGR